MQVLRNTRLVRNKHAGTGLCLLTAAVVRVVSTGVDQRLVQLFQHGCTGGALGRVERGQHLTELPDLLTYKVE